MRRCLFVFILAGFCAISFGQGSVPAGIHYQAVARDSYGKELINKDIDVRFSIISESPLGTLIYQELHSDITTSKYGVFSLVIGHGTPTGGTCSDLSQVSWADALHYLKVEVKFANDFLDMGTMQFLSVPYALYAQKSLEAGPAGPKGDQGEKGEPGDPASDDQTLSFDENTLTISGGNSVPLSSLLQTLTINKTAEGNFLGISRGNSVLLATIEADGDPKNELQDLVISSDKLKITNNTVATEWDLSPYRQTISLDPSTRVLSISGTSSTVNLSELKDDADADATNEIQDILLTDNLLTVTKNSSSTGVNLSKYLDNTDSQQLTFNGANNTLSISGGNSADLSKFVQSLSFNTSTNQLSISNVATPVDLSSLKNDADADPANEIQQLTYSESTNSLSITNGNTVSLGAMVAFRAKKPVSETVTTFMSDYDFIAGNIDYNDGSGYNSSTGVFSAPATGIYTINISYNATGTGDSRVLKVFLNGSLYEILNNGITTGSSITRSITMKLSAGDKVKPIINVGTGFETGTGSFSGFRVY
ncbi:MAG TPA: hypothetical protein PKM69_03255 [Bacteroidales bacterium]|nr:hypothetical protein [Bacteroidales bacterium]